MLIYQCPKHGKAVRTNIETTENEVRRLAAFKLSVWCPHCEDAHVILGKDATVASTPTVVAVPAPAVTAPAPTAPAPMPSNVRVAA